MLYAEDCIWLIQVHLIVTLLPPRTSYPLLSGNCWQWTRQVQPLNSSKHATLPDKSTCIAYALKTLTATNIVLLYSSTIHRGSTDRHSAYNNSDVSNASHIRFVSSVIVIYNSQSRVCSEFELTKIQETLRRLSDFVVDTESGSYTESSQLSCHWTNTIKQPHWFTWLKVQNGPLDKHSAQLIICIIWLDYLSTMVETIQFKYCD